MTTKVCKSCNKEFKSPKNSQQYCCEECRLKAKATRKKAQSKSKVDLRANPHKLCNRETCLYHNQPGPNRCDYFYLTNKLRGCKSGDSCTRYERATESERKKYRNKMLREDEQGRNKSITVSYYYESLPQCDVYRRYNKLVGKN